MDFLFEVKFKNGKVQQIRIRASIEADAVRQLMSMYGDIANYKILN